MSTWCPTTFGCKQVGHANITEPSRSRKYDVGFMKTIFLEKHDDISRCALYNLYKKIPNGIAMNQLRQMCKL